METTYPKTICPNRFRIFGEADASVPCCLSHDLDTPNRDIQLGVIVIHGVLRNGDEYFLNMMAAVNLAGVQDTTLVAAPQFLLEEDLDRFALGDDILFWGGETGEGWKKGDDSLSTDAHPCGVNISAFEVADQMIVRLCRSEIFPNLKRIVVAGHSAGGQYVNRFAAGSEIESSVSGAVKIRYVVANPSTFLYFNEERRVGDAVSEFAIPESAQRDYDDYKYGLGRLNRYMSASGADRIRQTYPQKEVVYLLGGEDTRKEHLEQTPNAMLQGANRLERGQIYYHYLVHYFGEAITANHKIAIVPCVGHDNAAIFNSETGVKYLFDG
jgi:hypothetical protein